MEIGAETVLVMTPFYAKIKAVQPRTQVKRVIVTNIKEHLSPVMRVLFTLAMEKKQGHRVAVQPGDHLLADSPPEARRRGPACDPARAAGPGHPPL